MFKYNIYGLKILSDISISDIEENKFDGNEDIKVISEIYKGNLKIENNIKKNCLLILNFNSNTM